MEPRSARIDSARRRFASQLALVNVGHEVIVARAQKVRLIVKRRQKHDRLDARTLARLARIDPELRIRFPLALPSLVLSPNEKPSHTFAVSACGARPASPVARRAFAPVDPAGTLDLSPAPLAAHHLLASFIFFDGVISGLPAPRAGCHRQPLLVHDSAILRVPGGSLQCLFRRRQVSRKTYGETVADVGSPSKQGQKRRARAGPYAHATEYRTRTGSADRTA
jgi:hypothetical protein